MNSFDDDPWGSEVEIDRQLRRAFVQTFADREPPTETLDALRPSFRRARTVHRMRQASLGAVAAVILLAAMAGVARFIPGDELGLTVAGEVAGDATGDGAQHSADGQDLAVNGTTTTASAEDDAVGRSEENRDDGDGGAPLGDTEPPNPGTGATTESTPDQSAPNTTTPTTRSSSNATTRGSSPPTTDPDSTTSIRPDGSIAVITECGQIIVNLDGGDVDLVEVQPDPGFRSDVKESTRRKIEVGLEGENGHCEAKITPSGNGLGVVVSTEGEHEHEHD